MGTLKTVASFPFKTVATILRGVAAVCIALADVLDPPAEVRQ